MARLRHLEFLFFNKFGVAIFYYDTWLPPFSRLIDSPEVLHFSSSYLLELLGRFINWEMVGWGFIFFVAYLFLARWLRMTLFSLLGVMMIGLQGLHWPGMALFQNTAPAASSTVAISSQPPTSPPAQAAPTLSLNELLDQELLSFYEAESKRTVSFSTSTSKKIDFDVLFINICSLSWDDLREVNLLDHPLFKNMDVVFDNFNSATSYSGPAVTRLLYANCGQQSHDELYENTPKHCSIFENLRQLGFETSVALNDTGEFQNFKDTIIQADPASTPMVPSHLKPALRSFYDSPLWNDLEVLNLWAEQHPQTPSSHPQALLYNTVTLHDGNREATADGASRPSPYEKRAANLLDELNVFINQLEKEGRRALVVLVPEHGAALAGDKIQISGMREIPTPEITRIPVGLRLVGAKSPLPATPIRITEPSSFLALSELIGRLLNDHAFDEARINWPALVANLPETRPLSENEGVVIMHHEGKPYVRLQGKNWVEYQQ